jgi:serine/threonine protein kinase
MRMKALDRSIHPDVSPRPSTWFYKSPEVLGREVCGIAGDVYAFACVVYVVSGHRMSRRTTNVHSLQVYDSHGPFELNPDVYFGGLQHMVERRILQKPNEMSQGLWELLQKCWKFDPLERPTMQQILCWMA